MSLKQKRAEPGSGLRRESVQKYADPIRFILPFAQGWSPAMMAVVLFLGTVRNVSILWIMVMPILDQCRKMASIEKVSKPVLFIKKRSMSTFHLAQKWGIYCASLCISSQSEKNGMEISAKKSLYYSFYGELCNEFTDFVASFQGNS